MRGIGIQRLGRAILWSIALACVWAPYELRAQSTAPAAQAPQPATNQNQIEMPAAETHLVTCVEPAPLLSLDDYEGPLKKVAGSISRKLERKSVHQLHPHHPHYKPGLKLCTLEASDKFRLFASDLVDPLTFAGSGFNAGLDQAQANDPSFGVGAGGYAKRYLANYADQASGKFFTGFLYPTLFGEDPRYYRMGRGSKPKRLLHAASHVFVGYRDSGRRMINLSEWVGTASAVTLSNTYHPDNKRGVYPVARWTLYTAGMDMGFDILREFLPEICRKLKLPLARHEHASTLRQIAVPAR